jgi:two-component system C4-dicarboxylate transport sensor histidine kinase DctB
LRRRRNIERQRAQRTLERVHGELEQRIGERTAVLVSANDQLESKIRELDRTQAALRAMQDELVQAGKLTVIGQMAVSITHEINQPLAALRALNDNALVLLDRGDDAAVHSNLESIRELTQRMTTIVGQLKGFARKDDIRYAPVPLEPAIASAVAMVSADARRHGVEIVVHPAPAELAVQGQSVRIEQILVNLLRNAIDACAEGATRRVDIHVRREGDTASLHVGDTGCGIGPQAMGRLFEPFFTTKPAGVGLGLGLAISGSIANALGGSLQAANREQGGAEFTLRLPVARWSPEQARASQRTIG